MKNQKGSALLIVLIIAALIAAGGFVLYKKGGLPQVNNQMPYQTSAIQNDADLTQASNDLDTTNLDTMDSQLNQNDTDASSF